MSSVASPEEVRLAETDYHAFNVAIWERMVADPELAKLDFRFETDRHGQIIMSRPPAPPHGNKQGEIAYHLCRLNSCGRVVSECPISTSEGVKAADVAWCSEVVWNSLEGRSCFTTCPEVCVEVLSPSNTRSEIDEKRRLYFEAGAAEVWFCSEDGKLTFHLGSPDALAPQSRLFPEFPLMV